MTASKPQKKTAPKKSKKQEAIARAKSFIKTKRTSVIGTVQNADPDFRYYYFDRSGLTKGRELRLRADLDGKGYEESSDGEYVVGADAVIYKIPKEAHDLLFAERCRRAEERASRLEHAKKDKESRESVNALERAITQADPEVMERLKSLLNN